MATLTQMKKGLSLRPTYDQVLAFYLSGGPNIPKPDRKAQFVRESPQYQQLLKSDFIDLQKQQNDILMAQKREVLLKEQIAGSNADRKSVLASQRGSETLADRQLNESFDSLRNRDEEYARQYEFYSSYLKDLKDKSDYKIKERGGQLVEERLNEVKAQREHLGGLRDVFKAPLSPDPQTQMASSSSQAPSQYDISTPRERSRSTKGTRGESINPEMPPPRRGRPALTDEEKEQRARAKAEAKAKAQAQKARERMII